MDNLELLAFLSEFIGWCGRRSRDTLEAAGLNGMLAEAVRLRKLVIIEVEEDKRAEKKLPIISATSESPFTD